MRGAPISYDAGMNPSGTRISEIVQPWVRGQGSWTFAAPKAGLWTFYLWGPGNTYFTMTTNAASPRSGGAPGGLAIVSERFAVGQTAGLIVGRAGRREGGVGAPPAVSATDTVLTLPSGRIVTAKAGGNPIVVTDGDGNITSYTPGAPGTGIGGDINLSGGIAGTAAVPNGSSGQGEAPGAGGTGTSSAPAGGGAPGLAWLPGGQGGNGVVGSGSTAGGEGGFPGGGGGAAHVSANGAVGRAGNGGEAIAIAIYQGA